MTRPGNQTAYRADYADLARNYCLLGATNEQLGRFFGVTRRTVDNWIATHPAFADAVREAKAEADARVARALYQRAIGYKEEVQRTFVYRGEAKDFTAKMSYPPDTQACIFWLRNRCPEAWRGRPEPPMETDEDENGDALVAELDAAGESVRHAVRG